MERYSSLDGRLLNREPLPANGETYLQFAVDAGYEERVGESAWTATVFTALKDAYPYDAQDPRNPAIRFISRGQGDEGFVSPKDSKAYIDLVSVYDRLVASELNPRIQGASIRTIMFLSHLVSERVILRPSNQQEG